MKTTKKLKQVSLFILSFSIQFIYAQFPAKALVGYYETWNSDVNFSTMHDNYNVINMAFATTLPGSACELNFDFPYVYGSKSAFLNAIDAVHAKNKVVLISIGGETGQIQLESESDKNKFVNSLKSIFADFSYKIDGIDIDIEGAAVQTDETNWTMTSLTNRQKFLVQGIKEFMADYKSHTQKKMSLTMAPEVAYVQGGLSEYQVGSINGGWYLPIIESLRDELDMLNVQLYNVYGEAYALDGNLYMEGSGNFIAAMVETAIKGFTLKGGKGVYSGLPASKVGIGTVGNNSCASYDAGSLMNTSEVISAAKYLRGKITKPAGWNYTCISSYPDLKGMMVWSINKDFNSNGTGICDVGAWSNANAFSLAFEGSPNDVSKLKTDVMLQVYPNPAHNVAFINNNSEDVLNVALMNDIGEVIKVLGLMKGLNVISMDDLNTGVYFIRSTKETYKLIIQ